MIPLGINGKENDNEVKGVGDQIDYGMRVYDPRIGKFLGVDPLTQSYPWYTPYQYAGNQPIWAIDLDGLEPIRSAEQQAKEDKAQQARIDADYIKNNTPREGTNGLFHLHSATPAEENFHPVRAYVKNFFYYSAKYLTLDIGVDDVITTWGSKETPTSDKIAASAQLLFAFMQPEAPFEGPILRKAPGAGEGWGILTQFERNKLKGKWGGSKLATDLIHGLAAQLNETIDPENAMHAFGKYKRGRQNGRMDEWNYFLHGADCGFKNVRTVQKMEVYLITSLEFGVLDPFFFVDFIKSTASYQPLPVALYDDYADGHRILEKMVALGRFERIQPLPGGYDAVVVRSKV